MVVPICASLMVDWNPRMTTLLDQSSKAYASPSWTETPGRLSITDVTAVMLACCLIIGSATKFRAKTVGSSATTLIGSSWKTGCRTIETTSTAPARTVTSNSRAEYPARLAVRMWSPGATPVNS